MNERELEAVIDLFIGYEGLGIADQYEAKMALKAVVDHAMATGGDSKAYRIIQHALEIKREAA